LTPNFGVTARTFRKKLPPKNVDRSGWTDTPADRERKQLDELQGISSQKKPETSLDPAQLAKDMLYAEQVAEYNNSARAKSLLELHTEKLHKPSKKSKKSKSKKKSKHKHKSRSDDDDDEKTSKDRHHRKKKKKEKKETVAPRRPFDRDVDLQGNRLDSAKRKSLINKSQQLGGRFGHGSAQFL